MEAPVVLGEYNDGRITTYTDGSVSYDAWVKRGFGSTSRRALSIKDPDHVYNYLKSFGLTPEDYDIIHPVVEKYGEMSRSELMAQLAELELEVEEIRRMFC